MSETILRFPSVKAQSGLSRSHIYEQVQRGEFPAPVRLGRRAVGWLQSEVDAWIASRPASSVGRDSSVNKSGRV